MKALVTGGRGMLAQALQRLLPEAVFLGRQDLDVTSADGCLEALEARRPEVVFNLAAYTRVDDAERDEDRATAVNGDGAGNLARACRKLGVRLLHVSTDYVFNGSDQSGPPPLRPWLVASGGPGSTPLRPWVEEDPVGPISAYGRSKLRGEELVEYEQPDSLIVRTAWLYGPGGPNFVDTMLRLAAEREEIRVVDDQIGSPTFTTDLAEALFDLAEGGYRGLCHFACSGQTSWHGFAERILGRAGYRGRIVAIPSSELKRPAPRPAYSVLDTGRYRSWTNRQPRPWQEAADEFLEQRLGSTTFDAAARI